MPASGAVLEIAERHVEALRDHVESGRPFTDVVDRDLPITAVQPCVVVTPSLGVIAVGQLTAGRFRIATRRLVVFSDADLVGPWTIEEIASDMPRPSAARIQKLLGDSVIPPKTWQDFVEAIGRIDESAAARLQKPWVDRAHERHLLTQQEERDAFLLSFDLAGMRRPIAELPLEPGQHFLDGAETAGLLEAHLVHHDALAGLPGWDRGRDPQRAYRFVDGDRSLTVMNVGSDRPETATGVDLIYWRESPDAFVLVQYKRLSAADGRYRPSGDRSFTKELATMRAVLTELGKLAVPYASAAEYRLSSEPFFFKFCKPVQSSRDSRRLMSGMYVPLSYWDVLSNSGALAGPAAGVSIGFDNVPRWITNTQFVDLIAGAWLGTYGAGSRLIARLVRASLGLGKSVIIGIEHPRAAAPST